MNQAQLDGITKARLAACIADNQATYATDADYLARVCADAGLAELPAHAADSYAQQWSGQTILELEAQLAAMLLAAESPDAPPPPEWQEYAQTPEQRRALLRCSPAQGRLALLNAGLLDAVEAWVATQSRAVQIEYASRPEWRRDWPLVANAGLAFGLTDAQLDDLFTLAPTL
ncbi:MAG: hypothetical protein KAX46_03125 [Chromatiaceae bacterium]|nr:hypothetical protein [Chromatiaceae bacterium]